MDFCRFKAGQLSAAIFTINLMAAGLVWAEEENISADPQPSATPDTPAPGRSDDTRADSQASQPSALELHHARQTYRELYALSQEYRQMLQVLDQNYGSPSQLTSAGNETATDSESSPSAAPSSAENSSPDGNSIELSDCPSAAYMHYSRNQVNDALTTVRSCVQKQRSRLAAYGKALSQDTDAILSRLSDRIQALMGQSSYSSSSVSSRKLSKGRNLLQISLKTAQQAQSMLAENPETAIKRFRVARFQAIQGLILLETSYEGEQKLKKEFETALLDAEGKVHIKPLDEDKYRKVSTDAEKKAE
ncbi:MAG: hypothetical protein CMN76_16430 [Spirochaetaceae bacterium]|nr:hypothetical protein [Spirochaetaceae bacterium]|tara:strand:+ start:13788 stop:14702 length:915 start_codon:yes stop_codon:yes gene_type:complete